MAESGSQTAPNFIPIIWISQSCPNRGYSQYVSLLGDIWFFRKLGQLFCYPQKHNLREIKYGEA